METPGFHRADTTGVLGELTALLDRVEEQVVAGQEVSAGVLADLQRAAEVLAEVASRDFLRFDDTIEVLRTALRVEHAWAMVERARISRDLRQAQDRLRDAVGADAWQLYLDVEEVHNSRGSHWWLQTWHGLVPRCLAKAALFAAAPTAVRRACADRAPSSQDG